MPTAKSHQPGVTFAVDLSLEILYDLLAIRFDSIITIPSRHDTAVLLQLCRVRTLQCTEIIQNCIQHFSFAVHVSSPG